MELQWFSLVLGVFLGGGLVLFLESLGLAYLVYKQTKKTIGGAERKI